MRSCCLSELEPKSESGKKPAFAKDYRRVPSPPSTEVDGFLASSPKCQPARGVKRGFRCLAHQGARCPVPFFRCGIADPRGVCDVKDQCGSRAEALGP